ncbi:MAG: hypothetical protein KAT43_06390 [Nanoarchaeota archaeon]|nr:hypothetical protein [Nanoarchaeota archaeon]
MADDEYITLKPKPRRSRRFLQLVAKHALMHKLKQSHEYRSKFLEKIDKLRNIEQVSELRKVEKVKPMAPKPAKHLESQIQRMLEIEHFLENEMKFNRQILSRLSENDVTQLELLRKVLKKDKVDDSKIEILDEKIKQIDQLKKSVKRLRASVGQMSSEEKAAIKREKTSGRKLDVLSSRFENEEQLLRQEMEEMKAMREKLDRVSKSMVRTKKAKKKPIKKKVMKTQPVKKKPKTRKKKKVLKKRKKKK